MAELRLTPTRLAALQIVADGDLEYATGTGQWEPKRTYRSPAFDWLDEHDLIVPEFGAEPVGRVLKLIPVRLTDAGRAVLNEEKR